MARSIERKEPRFIARVACVMTIALMWPVASLAATSFYVDPDWTGGQTGAAASPWRSLSSAAWTVINNALSSGDVVVYFSAREAGVNVNETTTTALAVRRTNSSQNRLTLDGNSQYNGSDSVPSWTTNTGTSRFQITATYPISTISAPNSNVTVRGFRAIATNGQIIFWWGGHNVIIEDNDVSSSPGATLGPAIYFGYTQEELSNCPTASGKENCTVFTNLFIRQNYIHDTFGEGIYVGGCANNSGCLAHNGVTVEGNVLRNVAVYGGEPDAIDIKDGLRNVVIRGNDIRLQQKSRDGISLESGAIVERNYVESAGRIGIAFSAYWNNSGATRAGTVARNNIIVNTGGKPRSTASAFA